MKKLLILCTLLVCFTVVCGFSVYSHTIVLDEDNTIVLQGVINDYAAQQFFFKFLMLNMNKSTKPIYLYINSPGGSLGSAEAIIEIAKKSRRPVHTISSFAASAAFNIVQSLNKRYITSDAVLLTHNAYFNIFRVNPNSSEELEHAKADIFPVYERVAKRLKMTSKEYQTFMDASAFVKGENNIKINTADEIIDIQCTKKLILSGDCPY